MAEAVLGIDVTLYLIRHAESTWNVERRYQGQADSGLTRRGRIQAELLGERFVAVVGGVDMIVSSDLPRAYDTAAPLATRLDMRVLTDSRLREVDTGSWTGKKVDEVVREDPKSAAAFERGDDIRRGDGETFGEVRARVSAALRDLVELARRGSPPVKTIAVFTHGGPIRVAAAEALRVPSPGHENIAGAVNCGLPTIRASSTGLKLVDYNQRVLDWSDAGEELGPDRALRTASASSASVERLDQEHAHESS
jgi:probable phosphoglycerate mutase